MVDLQHIVVAIVVPACALYVAWALIGRRARQALAAWAARLPLPGPLARRVRQAADTAGACGCDGCDRAADSRPEVAKVSVVKLHRTRR